MPPFIAQGSSAMVRVLELPPGDPGLTVANLLTDRTSRLVVVMMCAPGVGMTTMVSDEELAAKASRRIPVPTR